MVLIIQIVKCKIRLFVYIKLNYYYKIKIHFFNKQYKVSLGSYGHTNYLYLN
jgi:hypothetical protein